MRYAEKHGFPIITFVDTPGAFADLKSEELNQVVFLALFFSTLTNTCKEGNAEMKIKEL